MTCEELRDSYGTYALGALDGDELGELREHLGRGCENCLPGVRSAMADITRLAGGVKQVSPPRRLRKRILSMVNPKAGHSRVAWLWAATAAFLLFTTVFAAIGVRNANLDLAKSQIQMSEQQSAMARMSETLAIFQDPVAKEVTFGKGATGRIVISPKRGVAFSGQNMAALPANKVFELWIIPKGGNPAPAGTFTASADGSAVHIHTAAVDVTSTAAVAVSIENAGGVQQPTKDQIIIVAPVGE